MRSFEMHQRSYDISLWGFTEITTLMAQSNFRFTIRTFHQNTLLPGLPRSSALFPTQTFFQQAPHFIRILLSPLSEWRTLSLLSPQSSQALFDTHTIETIANVAADQVQETFQVHDAAAASASSSSESQSPEVSLSMVINVTDNRMRAATQNSLGTVPAAAASSEEAAIDRVLKKSRVVQSECCCCVCLDEFEVNAECYTLPCQHFFHHKCIFQWLRTSRTCPMCRYPLLTQKTSSKKRVS